MNEITLGAERLVGRWHKGDYTDGMGNFCGIGHLYAANSALSARDLYSHDPDELVMDEELRERLAQACKVLNEVAVAQYPDRTREFFVDFNDHPETTESEVLAVMDKAAVLFDERYALQA